jgi:hypothetical protein
MMSMALMRHANQQLSEIKKWEWEDFVWTYDELIRSFGMSTQKGS